MRCGRGRARQHETLLGAAPGQGALLDRRTSGGRGLPDPIRDRLPGDRGRTDPGNGRVRRAGRPAADLSRLPHRPTDVWGAGPASSSRGGAHGDVTVSGSLVDTSGRVWPSPGPREEAALLVVDVQRDFTDPALLPWLDTADQERITAAVERVNALVAAARAMEVRVVWVRLAQEPDRPWGSSRWLRGLLDACEDTLREQEPCLAGTPGADWYRVAPAPGEEVVVKRRYSAFHD